MLLPIVMLSVAGLAQENTAGNANKKVNTDTTVSSKLSAKFISLEDATKILGKPAHLKDKESRSEMGTISNYYNCMYKSIPKSDADTVSSLFFSLEEYLKPAEAERMFNVLKTEYKKYGSPPSDISDIGDEGFLAPDKLKFPFIVIRKNNKVFKFKMDYARSSSSVSELNVLVKKIVSLN